MNRTYSISELARLHGLSRSTLLYYDRIGLLRAGDRSRSNYRRYSQLEAERLRRIVRFRHAGLALDVIRDVLDAGQDVLPDALVARLQDLNHEIRRLREQQRFIIDLLGSERRHEKLAFMSRDRFVAMLEATGFTDADMDRWHSAFERSAPDEHQRFLEFLCIPDAQIRSIRRRAGVAK